MSTYHKITSAIGASQQLARIDQVLGSSGMRNSRVATFVRGISDRASLDVRDNVGTLAGAGIGAYLGWKRGYPIIGAIAGGSLGRNVPALLEPHLRKTALVNMGVTGAAVAVALARGGRSAWNRFLNFAVVWVGGNVATYLTGLRK